MNLFLKVKIRSYFNNDINGDFQSTYLLEKHPNKKIWITIFLLNYPCQMYDTLEFNEFLTMIAKQFKHEITLDSLIEAFRWVKLWGGNQEFYFISSEFLIKLRRASSQPRSSAGPWAGSGRTWRAPSCRTWWRRPTVLGRGRWITGVSTIYVFTSSRV